MTVGGWCERAPLVTPSPAPPGDPRYRPNPLPPGSGAGLHTLRASTHGPGGAGAHAPTVHAQRSAHGEPHVCFPSEHGPAGHLLWEQVRRVAWVFSLRLAVHCDLCSSQWWMMRCCTLISLSTCNPVRDGSFGHDTEIRFIHSFIQNVDTILSCTQIDLSGVNTHF